MEMRKIYIAELEKLTFAPGDSPGGHAAQHCQQEYAYYRIKQGISKCRHQIQLVKGFYIIIKIQTFRQRKRTVQIQFLFRLEGIINNDKNRRQKKQRKNGHKYLKHNLPRFYPVFYFHFILFHYACTSFFLSPFTWIRATRRSTTTRVTDMALPYPYCLPLMAVV